MKRSTVEQIIGEQVVDLVTAETEDTGEEAPRVRINSDDYVRGKERVQQPIPVSGVTEEPHTKLYEIIDDWQGWRVEYEGHWHLITFLGYTEGNDDVSLQIDNKIVAFNKDETPVIR